MKRLVFPRNDKALNLIGAVTKLWRSQLSKESKQDCWMIVEWGISFILNFTKPAKPFSHFCVYRNRNTISFVPSAIIWSPEKTPTTYTGTAEWTPLSWITLFWRQWQGIVISLGMFQIQCLQSKIMVEKLIWNRDISWMYLKNLILIRREAASKWLHLLLNWVSRRAPVIANCLQKCVILKSS